MDNENVFSPYIYNLMKQCLKEKKQKSIADLTFLFTLCQNKTVSMEVLKEWFKFYNIEIDCFDRRMIIRNFLKVVDSEPRVQKTVYKLPEAPKTRHRRNFGIKSD